MSVNTVSFVFNMGVDSYSNRAGIELLFVNFQYSGPDNGFSIFYIEFIITTQLRVYKRKFKVSF